MKKSALLGLCLLFLCLFTTPAFAHATLVQSTPVEGAVLKQNPGTVKLLFSETLSPELIELNLYNWEAERIELPPPQLTKGNAAETYAELPSDLEPGSYRLRWSIISEDGHLINGELSFALGHVSADIAPIAEDGTRENKTVETLHVVAHDGAESMVLIATGLYLLSLYARRMEVPQASDLLGRWKKIGWALLLLLSLGELITTLIMLEENALQRVFLQGELGLLTETPFLVMVLLQLLLLVLLAVPGMMKSWPALLFTLLTLNMAQSGHALAIEPVWLALALRMLHLLSIALWLGGLLYLLLLWRQLLEKSRFRSFFLRVFLGSSLLVALSGVLMVAVQTDWSAVLAAGTLWSGLLFSKISLMAVMLALALVQSRRWRKDAAGLSYPLLRIEWIFGLLVILAGVGMSMIAYP
ncbi:copper transport protein [Tumebacillus sp. BK434]|uniref:copper resistance CopC/CopD family protein n=1 Tax=Tumebacillus sp. BK434 TaxID=2512169 RepID=UPI001048F79A|nr:copper resistance protein CopC [Tumebacillus sp. BK434]TCP54707.1 copper transport protein [Tumebacillus sp. BK434]